VDRRQRRYAYAPRRDLTYFAADFARVSSPGVYPRPFYHFDVSHGCVTAAQKPPRGQRRMLSSRKTGSPLSLSLSLSVQVHACGCVRLLAYKCNTPPGRYITRVAHAASVGPRAHLCGKRTGDFSACSRHEWAPPPRTVLRARARDFALPAARLLLPLCLSVFPLPLSLFLSVVLDAPRGRFCGRLAPSFGSARFPPEDKKGTRAP